MVCEIGAGKHALFKDLYVDAKGTVHAVEML